MTVACCCGHKTIPGRIDLEDGRILVIAESRKHMDWQGDKVVVYGTEVPESPPVVGVAVE